MRTGRGMLKLRMDGRDGFEEVGKLGEGGVRNTE